MPPLPPDAIVNRLDEGLTKADQEIVKEQFVKFIVDEGRELRTFRSTKKDHIDDFICHLDENSPLWGGLGHIDDIWDETAIHHLKNTLKNQLRDNGSPLAARIEAYRKTKQQAADPDPNADQIDSSSRSKKATPAKVKMLGKRARDPSSNPSELKGVTASAPAEKPKENAKTSATNTRGSRRFDPTMFSTAEWAVVENELQCQVYWDEI